MTNTSSLFPPITPFARLINEQSARNGEAYRYIVEHASAEQVLMGIHDHAVRAAAHLAVERRIRAATGDADKLLDDYQALAHELVRLSGLAAEREHAKPPDAETVVTLAIARDADLAASCAAGDGVRTAREELARTALLAWHELQRTEVGSRPTIVAVYMFAHVLGEALELA